MESIVLVSFRKGIKTSFHGFDFLEVRVKGLISVKIIANEMVVRMGFRINVGYGYIYLLMKAPSNGLR